MNWRGKPLTDIRTIVATHRRDDDHDRTHRAKGASRRVVTRSSATRRAGCHSDT